MERFGRILTGLAALWALLGHFARFCMYFAAFCAFLVIFDQANQAKPCFTFSRSRMRASTTLKRFRSSRSLLRQVLEGVGRPIRLPKSIFGVLFPRFFRYLYFGVIFYSFWLFFKVPEPLKLVIFPRENAYF